MALLFTNAASDRVENNSTDSLDNITAGTALLWVYRTATSSDRFFFCKGRTDLSRAKYMKVNSSDNGQGAGSVQLGVYRATTSLLVEATGGPVAQDSWECVAAVWNTAGVDGDQHLYTGDLNAALAEVGSYVVRQVGTGTVADDSADIFVTGNHPVANNLSFAGRIAILMVWNRVLTLAELQAQQFRPHRTSGCVLFAQYGEAAGVGIQPDFSGNDNFGTITGATLADHVPLPKEGFQRLYGSALLTTSAATLFATPTSFRDTISQIRLVNNSGSTVTVTLSIGTDAAGTRIVDADTLAAGESKSVLGPFTLEAAQFIQGFAGAAGVVTATIVGERECL